MFFGTGVVLKRPDDIVIEYALRLTFKVANNMVEYEVLSKGLDLVKEMKPKKLNIYSNSQLLVGFVGGQFKAKKENMAKY